MRDRIEEVLHDRLAGAIRASVAEQLALHGSLDGERMADGIRYRLQEVMRERIAEGVRERIGDAVRDKLRDAIRTAVVERVRSGDDSASFSKPS